MTKPTKPQQANIPKTVGETSFAEFLDDNESSDASFTCSDGVRLEVHRVFLIKKSAEFKKIFATMKQQQKIMEKFNDVDSVTMKEILKYAYTGSADLKDIQVAKKTYQAAITYDLPELQLQCADSLHHKINSQTVLDIFEMANELKLEKLTEKSLHHIMK